MKASKDLPDALEEERARANWELSLIESSELIAELYSRKVEIKEIFGRYLEYEVAGDGRQMNVEDATLAYGTGTYGDKSF